MIPRLLIMMFLFGCIFYYLWVLSADPRISFSPAKWWAVLPITIICIVPIMQRGASINPNSPIYNALLAFGLSSIMTPLLFSSIKFSFVDGLKDKIFISIIRMGFASFFIVIIPYFDSVEWFYYLCGIGLSLFITRYDFYRVQQGGTRRFILVILSFFVIIFFYSIAIDYSKITYENWSKAFSFLK